jgi:cellulose/xylan binding protein with CBM9 domain
VKTLQVVRVKQISYTSSVTELSGLLDRLDKNELNNVPWPAWPYRPSASFTISYGPDALFLKFFITEKELRAVNDEINGPVWEDSCVEMFISIGDAQAYYNFEINSVGTILAAYGTERNNRTFLPVETIRAIKTFTVIDRLSRLPEISWDIIIVIPFTAFVHDSITTLHGVHAKANFYKCGDKLKDPHYLSWNHINSPEPEFHLPDHFGNLMF